MDRKAIAFYCLHNDWEIYQGDTQARYLASAEHNGRCSDCPIAPATIIDNKSACGSRDIVIRYVHENLEILYCMSLGGNIALHDKEIEKGKEIW